MKKIYLGEILGAYGRKPTAIVAENIEEASYKFREFLKQEGYKFSEIERIKLLETSEVLE